MTILVEDAHSAVLGIAQLGSLVLGNAPAIQPAPGNYAGLVTIAATPASVVGEVTVVEQFPA